ncbi:MAG: hypothetical protein LBQ12_12590 [Deltaproteobacteria bacterium]|jgi:hypothetical protein|nr:hypothetical protein [Deltaproteobacteria bacterium]
MKLLLPPTLALAFVLIASHLAAQDPAPATPYMPPFPEASLLKIFQDFDENEPAAKDAYGKMDAVYITEAVIQRVLPSSSMLHTVILDVPESQKREKPLSSGIFICRVFATPGRPEHLEALKNYKAGDVRLFAAKFDNKGPATITFNCTDVDAVTAANARKGAAK